MHHSSHRQLNLCGAVAAFVLYSALSAGQTKKPDSSAGAIYRSASPAVVLIEVYNGKGEVSGAGSGFLVSADGRILTNYHVVEHSKRATVRLANKDAYDDVQVLDVDKRKDVALLKIKAVDLPYLTLGKSGGVEIGDKVFSLSNPLGLLQNTLSEGIVSGVRELDGYRYFQISAPISHGSSGGPIFNTSGLVIGIAVAILEEGQNLNFAVPIDYAKGLLSATQPRPLASIYEPEPEPENGVSAAGGQRTKPNASSPSPTGEPCTRNAETAQEVLRLGRSLGYPDDEIVEAYGAEPCMTLAYLRKLADQKPQSTQRPATEIPSGMIEALSYEYDASVGDVLQTVQTATQFYGIRCQVKLFAKCGWLSSGVRYKAEIEGQYIYVTTYKDENPQKPQRVKFEILVIKSRSVAAPGN